MKLTLKKASILIITTFITALCACQKNEGIHSKTPTDDEKTHDHSQHSHSNLEIKSFGDDIAIPSVSFTIEADTMSGWNIQVHTTNFHFSPEKINTPATPGEGHAHIYIDGFKIARIYSHWYHLKNLTPGEHKVRISLNANDHSNLSHQGQVIEAKQSIIQQ